MAGYYPPWSVSAELLADVWVQTDEPDASRTPDKPDGPQEGHLWFELPEGPWHVHDGTEWHTVVPQGLDDLTDVDLTTDAPADGDGLVYDAATSSWVPGEGAGSELLTVDAGQPQSDATIRYRYGIDGSGRVTYTDTGTEETPAVLLLDDTLGRFAGREAGL